MQNKETLCTIEHYCRCRIMINSRIMLGVGVPGWGSEGFRGMRMSALQCVAMACRGLHVDTLERLPTTALEKEENVLVLGYTCPSVCSTLFWTWRSPATKEIWLISWMLFHSFTLKGTPPGSYAICMGRAVIHCIANRKRSKWCCGYKMRGQIVSLPTTNNYQEDSSRGGTQHCCVEEKASLKTHPQVSSEYFGPE